jgi:hypothetical protein
MWGAYIDPVKIMLALLVPAQDRERAREAFGILVSTSRSMVRFSP